MLFSAGERAATFRACSENPIPQRPVGFEVNCLFRTVDCAGSAMDTLGATLHRLWSMTVDLEPLHGADLDTGSASDTFLMIENKLRE